MKVTSRHSFILFQPFLWKKPIFWGTWCLKMSEKTFKLCPCAWYPARKKKPERVTQMTWLKSKCKTTLFSRTIDFDQPLPRFWPKEKCPKSLLVLLGRNAKTIIFDTKCCLFLDHFHSVSFWHTQKKPCSIYLPISGPPRSSWDIMVAQAVFAEVW